MKVQNYRSTLGERESVFFQIERERERERERECKIVKSKFWRPLRKEAVERPMQLNKEMNPFSKVLVIQGLTKVQRPHAASRTNDLTMTKIASFLIM